MTHLLEPEQFGVLALLTAFQSFAGLVMINPVGQYLNRHTHQWYDEGTLVLRMRALSRYWVGVAVIVGGLASAWFAFGVQGKFDGHPVVAGVAVTLLVYTVHRHGNVTERLNMLGQRRASVTWQLAGTLTAFCVAWILTSWHPNAVSWLIGQSLGAGMGAAGAWRALVKMVPPSSSRATKGMLVEIFARKDFQAFCFPLVFITALQWMEGNGYRLILEGTWSLQLLGLFTMGLGIPAQLTSFVEQIVFQLIYPYFFRGLTGVTSEQQKQQVVSSMVNTLLPLFLLWGGFLFLAARPFLYLVTNAKYHAAADWVVYGVLLEVARLIAGLWTLNAQANKDYWPVIGPAAVGAALIAAATLLNKLPESSPIIFASLLVGALWIKSGLVILVMNRRISVRLDVNRVLLTIVALAICFYVSIQVPASNDLVGTFFYLMTVFTIMAVPVGLHLWTSPAARHLLSYRLNQP
jgi:uncharacterized membrane protein